MQLVRSEHRIECIHQRRQSNWELHLMGQPTQGLQRVWHALQEMRLALIETAEAIGSQRLHDANVNVRVVVLHEGIAIYADVFAQAVEIVVKQLLAQLRRKVGF